MNMPLSNYDCTENTNTDSKPVTVYYNHTHIAVIVIVKHMLFSAIFVQRGTLQM